MKLKNLFENASGRKKGRKKLGDFKNFEIVKLVHPPGWMNPYVSSTELDILDANGEIRETWPGPLKLDNTHPVTSLEGCPIKIEGDFDCHMVEINTLRFGPKEVLGYYTFSQSELTDLDGIGTFTGGLKINNNHITTLKHLNQHTINGQFNCSSNKLITLESGVKEVHGDFLCYDNELTTLEGGPVIVHGLYWCNNNKLTSLKGIPERLKNANCSHNNFTSLEGIHKIIKRVDGEIDFTFNPGIKSNVLGLLRIKKLQRVSFDNKKLESIINKYLPEGDILDCQEELIDAGLEEYAKL